MDEIKVMPVIYCTKKRRGEGEKLSPIRVVLEIFDLDGNLIAENDSNRIYSSFDMVSFATMAISRGIKDIGDDWGTFLKEYTTHRNKNQ